MQTAIVPVSTAQNMWRRLQQLQKAVAAAVAREVEAAAVARAAQAVVVAVALSELSELCVGAFGAAHDSDRTWCLSGITVGLSGLLSDYCRTTVGLCRALSDSCRKLLSGCRTGALAVLSAVQNWC